MSARAATHSRSAGLLFRCHFGWPVREKRAVPMRCAADGLVSSSFHFLSLAAASAANRRQASKNGSIQQTQARPFHTHFTYTHNSRRIQISQLPAAQIYIYTCYFIQTFNQTPSFKLFPPQSKKKREKFSTAIVPTHARRYRKRTKLLPVVFFIGRALLFHLGKSLAPISSNLLFADGCRSIFFNCFLLWCCCCCWATTTTTTQSTLDISGFYSILSCLATSFV